ncbi:MAG: hypothetical protein U1E23_05245 [Reyranellaceae bacterium]
MIARESVSLVIYAGEPDEIVAMDLVEIEPGQSAEARYCTVSR